MLEITLHEDADEEFKAALRFYESRQAGLGEAFLHRVSAGFDLIVAQPFAGQVLSDNYRRCLIRQFRIRSFIASKPIGYTCSPWPIGVAGQAIGKHGANANARSHNRFIRWR